MALDTRVRWWRRPLGSDSRKVPRHCRRQPPVGAPGDSHGGGNQHHPNERRVDDDSDSKAEAELLELQHIRDQEAAEDRSHDGGAGGDLPGRSIEADGDGVIVVPASLPLLLHPSDEEDLVVHGKSEEQGKDRNGEERLQRPHAAESKQLRQVAFLEYEDRDPERSAGGQQIEQHGLCRQQQAPKDDQQVAEGESEHDQDDQREFAGRLGGEIHVLSGQTTDLHRHTRSGKGLGRDLGYPRP